ncbi:MAG: Fe-S cluster assembly protein IscX [Chromatiaceae bacterium]|jgi:FeS assembly protein IscX
MGLKWRDARALALALDDTHPDVNPRYLNLSDLRSWIRVLEGFDDDPDQGDERVLAAIQTAWIEERE